MWSRGPRDHIVNIFAAWFTISMPLAPKEETTVNHRLSISNHAVHRFQERVAPSISNREAVSQMRSILTTANSRSRPRWWTRVAGERPGCRYLYSASRADVCLVVREGVVVTVFSRSVCAAWRASQPTVDRPARHLRALPDLDRRWRATIWTDEEAA